ncbi:hypothetical protein MRB53_038680 [Persea americana]|nr:hypothetical protein MRB53_038680 [Persea americana]
MALGTTSSAVPIALLILPANSSAQRASPHPRPAPLAELHDHFPFLADAHTPVIHPAPNGESVTTLHDRYALHATIAALDSDPAAPRAMLLCTHAAAMICIGRALSGAMPDDPNQEDFRCGTCALSVYKRRRKRTLQKSRRKLPRGTRRG